jgi:hypothetical protein
MRYPLLPYSQLVFDMLKTNPDVYYTRFGLRVDKREVDIERLRDAFEQVLRNHPVFSMYIDDEGMQEYEPLTDIMHGQYHSVDFRNEGEYVRIDLAYNRILGDALSGQVWFDNLCRAYQGLPLLKDNYLDYIEHVERNKQSLRYASDREWLEREFCNATYPVHPRTDVPLDAPCIPVESTLLEDYSDLREKLNASEEKYLISLTAIFSLASALAIMEYNNTDEAALTWAYDGRETLEEQHIYGSLHRDIPFQINLKSQISNLKSYLIREARNQIRLGIAHSIYPFTLTKPHTDLWNYALNVLVQPLLEKTLQSFPFAFEMVASTEEPKIAYALLDVEIYDNDQLYINYRYSATHYKPESIQRFAALVRKYVLWLIND